MPEPSSNLYTLDQISEQLSIPLDELQAILDFYPTKNFPSLTVGSKTLYTEQALENISTLRSLEEAKLSGRQPVQDPARFPEAGAVRKVSEEATRRRIAAANRRKRVAKRKAKSPPGKPRTKEPSTLYTLSALSKKTGISMPTLQKYKRLYQRRIPSVGEGRKQRYPEEALAVVAAIKQENLKKRGRRKRPARKTVKDEAAPRLLPLTEISRRTGISYPTLVRYVKLHGNEIPSTGSGRKRRYPPEAIAVFKKIRSQSKRGPRPAKPAAKAARPQARKATAADQALAARIRALEDSQQRLAKQLANVIAELRKPILVTSGG